MNFTTEMESKEITIIEKHQKWDSPDFDYECERCYIDWNLSLEARSWGIKSFSPYATDARMDIVVTQYTDDDDIEVETIEIARQHGWEITSEFDPKDITHICPQDVTIDFKKKVVEVQF